MSVAPSFLMVVPNLDHHRRDLNSITTRLTALFHRSLATLCTICQSFPVEELVKLNGSGWMGVIAGTGWIGWTSDVREATGPRGKWTTVIVERVFVTVAVRRWEHTGPIVGVVEVLVTLLWHWWSAHRFEPK